MTTMPGRETLQDIVCCCENAVRPVAKWVNVANVVVVGCAFDILTENREPKNGYMFEIATVKGMSCSAHYLWSQIGISSVGYACICTL